MEVSENQKQREAEAAQNQASLCSRARTRAGSLHEVSPKTQDEAFIFPRHTRRPKPSGRLDSAGDWMSPQPLKEEFEDVRDRDSDSGSSGPPSPLDLTRTTKRQHRPMLHNTRARVGQPPQADCTVDRTAKSKRRASSPQSPLSRVLSPPLGSLTSIIAQPAPIKDINSDEWARMFQDDPYPRGLSTTGLQPKDSACSLPATTKPRPEGSQDVTPSIAESSNRESSPPQEYIDAFVKRCSFPRREPRPSTITTVEMEIVDGPGSASPNARSSLQIAPHGEAFDSMGELIESVHLTRVTSLAQSYRCNVLLTPIEQAERERRHMEFRMKVLAECGKNCQNNSSLASLCPFCEHVSVRFNPSDYLDGPNGLRQKALEARRRREALSPLNRFHVGVYISCGLLSTIMTYCIVMYAIWAKEPWPLLVSITSIGSVHFFEQAFVSVRVTSRLT